MLYEHYYLFLLINSHAFTIIGIELLEDSIQHSTSSCTLAQVSLAQLIDDIDFRILTYLEQQQQQLKQQYPDIRVRQAIASTFANLKKYTNTNESDFQAAVLNLLVQLLLIRHFIYCIAEFLVMLSHDTLHSKQVIKIQDLIKHYDSLLASRHEPETHTLAALEPVLYDFFLVQVMQIIKIPKTFYSMRELNVLNYYDYHFISHYYYNGHILNMLDYTQEEYWSPILTPSSLITHLSISGQLQSYCDLIDHHELYVEHFTSITTHYQLLLLLFFI
ncbi:unnamed protein product [Rotaria sp. Silwood1]|nr:unnamed protein product [Rotaria sp. Silwood1]CAF1632414.1 unnamed protein product [Rotaria sp. Silwood1]